MRVSVGVDLHKSQFTVYYRYEGTGKGMLKQYRTHRYGYEKFLCALRGYKAKGVNVEVAVEATGNARYFKNVVEREDVKIRVINTLKCLASDEIGIFPCLC